MVACFPSFGHNWPPVSGQLCHSHCAYQIRSGSGNHRSTICFNGCGSLIDSSSRTDNGRLLLSGHCNSSDGRHQRLSKVEPGQPPTSCDRFSIAWNHGNRLLICEIKLGKSNSHSLTRQLITICFSFFIFSVGLRGDIRVCPQSIRSSIKLFPDFSLPFNFRSSVLFVA